VQDALLQHAILQIVRVLDARGLMQFVLGFQDEQLLQRFDRKVERLIERVQFDSFVASEHFILGARRFGFQEYVARGQKSLSGL